MKTQFRKQIIPARAVATLVFALILSIGTLVQAQPNPDRPNRPAGERQPPQRQPQGIQPGGPGGFRSGQGLPMLEQVLTDDQRDSFRQVMVSQRETLRGLQEKIRDARKVMMTAAFAEDYKEEVVRAKALEVAKLEADVTVLRLKAIAEVQPALSQEQLDKILNPRPLQGVGPADEGPGPNRRNRPPDGGRDNNDRPQPAKRDPR
jgi:Spy/CpxP family protein refolding chaperone